MFEKSSCSFIRLYGNTKDYFAQEILEAEINFQNWNYQQNRRLWEALVYMELIFLMRL